MANSSAMRSAFVILVLALYSQVSEGGAVNDCSECQQELESLRSGFLDQLTQESASGFLEILCESFPEDEKQDCVQNLWYKALPTLSQLQDIDTKQICAAIGRCSDDVNLPTFLDVTKQTATNLVSEVEYRGMMCTVCMTTMNIVHHILSDNAFQKTLFRVLTKLCYFTGPLRRRCLSFLQRYGALIIEFAEDELTPKLCKTFRLCLRMDPLQTQPVSRGILCSVCKRITNTVHFLVHDKDNERRLMAITKYMCKRLPSPFSTMCDGFASLVLPELFDYLRSNCQIIDHICKILGLCSSEDHQKERKANIRTWLQNKSGTSQRLLFVSQEEN